MNCPTCNVTLLLTERQGIEIDYCPQCRGIWLDRGELDKLIEKSAVETKWNRYENDNDDRYKQTYPEYRKRKKSFLGEIFGFD